MLDGTNADNSSSSTSAPASKKASFRQRLSFSSGKENPATLGYSVDADSQDRWENSSTSSTASKSSIASRVSSTLKKRFSIGFKSAKDRFVDWDAILAGFQVDGTFEVKSAVTVRLHDSLESEAKAVLKPGTVFKILELSPNEKRRVKILAKVAKGVGVEGWISLASSSGELIVGDVTQNRQSVNDGVDFVPKYLKIKQLLEASVRGDLVAVKKIAESSGGIMAKVSGHSSRPSLNCCDVHGKTPLMYAANYSNLQVVAYLLSKTKDIDVNAQDSKQMCALHHAAQRPKPRAVAKFNEAQSQIVTYLLGSGAYIEARDRNGCTALMFSVANGDDTVTKNLLGNYANVNAKDYEGKTALEYADTFGHVKMHEILLDAGAEVLEGTTTGMFIGTGSKPLAGYQGPGEPAPAAEASAPGHESGDESPDQTHATLVPQDMVAGSPKAPSPSTGMMAAVAAREEVCEVAVMECAGEEDVDNKQHALAKLKALMESTVSVADLESAIREAMAIGVENEELQQAALHLKELKERAKALEKLRQAIADRDPKALKKYIAKAEEAQVRGDIVEEARNVLALEKPRQKAREKLLAAQESGDAEKLKGAIVDAKKAGLDSSEVAKFEELLRGAESREKAEAMLLSAMSKRDVKTLKFAIQQAKQAGVDSKHVKEAKSILKDEEPKQEARDLLAGALAKCTIAALAQAIESAKAAKLDPSEYKEAVARLKVEEERERRLGAVKAVMEEGKAVDKTDIDAVREAKEKLGGVIAEAVASGVPESDLREAENQRKRLHNTIEDLKGSVRVFCRIRPLSGKEKDQGDSQVTNAVDSMTLEIEDGGTFQFDAVFTPGTQEEIFEDCKDLVQSAVDGYNVTMFAYGQTGAGKTFTMYGVPGMEGTAPRTIKEIFRVIDQGKQRFTYTVMASMLELYRNDLVDLLNKGNPVASKSKLNVRQEKGGMVVVEHLTEESCSTAEQLSALLERGNAQRTVAATAMNSESSRSHLVLLIKIISVNNETKEQLKGKILICDLAGSERLKRSEVSGDLQKEAIEINKSLTALGDVIEALTKSQKVIPYRNHKLTQLMQDSLGGSAKTLMFVNCSPVAGNAEETGAALGYATRAKLIVNKVEKNQDSQEISRLKKVILMLSQQLEQARAAAGSPSLPRPGDDVAAPVFPGEGEGEE